MANNCPHCGAELIGSYNYCQKCTRRAVEYSLCEKCHEPIAKNATSCPYCSHRLEGAKEKAAKAIELNVRATRLGAFFTTGIITNLFLPPIIKIYAGRIMVTHWTLLGLRRHNQEIQVTRVASVRYTKGIIWGGILVETFGGASEDFKEKGLRQNDAREMAEQLKAALQD